MKKPRTRGGVLQIGWCERLSRASIRIPRTGDFFRKRDGAQNCDHPTMIEAMQFLSTAKGTETDLRQHSPENGQWQSGHRRKQIRKKPGL